MTEKRFLDLLRKTDIFNVYSQREGRAVEYSTHADSIAAGLKAYEAQKRAHHQAKDWGSNLIRWLNPKAAR